MARAFMFDVEGSRTNFPMDMLRYDACWPADTQDAELIAQMANGDLEHLPKRVKITLCTENRHAPTIGRWASFLWRVVP